MWPSFEFLRAYSLPCDQTGRGKRRLKYFGNDDDGRNHWDARANGIIEAIPPQA